MYPIDLASAFNSSMKAPKATLYTRNEQPLDSILLKSSDDGSCTLSSLICDFYLLKLAELDCFSIRWTICEPPLSVASASTRF